MINYVKGKIEEISGNVVVVDCGGIGYELTCSAQTVNKLAVGETAKISAYMHVREDGVSLYGFASLEEKRMFSLLISVSGIGPKVAIGILSGIDTNSLALAIFSGDTKALTKIKGMGKKTAERLVLELKEKVVVDASEAPVPVVASDSKKPLTREMADAVAVLCSLGKRQDDATKLVEAASELGAKTTEELINTAFRI